MAKRNFVYPGKQADVTWSRPLCIHVGECTRSGELFETGREPWCNPDLKSTKDVIEVVRRCPTGALSVERHDDQDGEQADQRNTVVVTNDGPLYLRGDLKIEGAPDDQPGLRFRAALCRCGASKNKPYCDNSHRESGFRDGGAVGESGDGFESEGGTLEVKLADNGPLLLQGNVTIIAASGREAWRGTKPALCRCGHSKNKPFCDGSHKEVGFVGD